VTLAGAGRFKRSRDIGVYLGLVPRRYQSGEINYTGSISKCGDRRARAPLYEAANGMLTRYKGPLKLKDWALAIARRQPCAKRGSRSPAAWRSSCMPSSDTARTSWPPDTVNPSETGGRNKVPSGATPRREWKTAPIL